MAPTPLARTTAALLALLLLLPAAAGAAAGAAVTVTVRNDVPRRDQWGGIVNAHDGSVIKFEGVYFMYGTVYENCTQHGTQCDGCGYAPNKYSLYTSYDLQSWTFVTDDILPEVDKDNHQVDYWMPVVYRHPSGTYVMQFWSGHCGFANPCTEVAFASSPYGPFSNITRIPLRGTPSSQMGFFVDPSDPASAYVKYNTVGPDQHHNVEKLTPDWSSSTGEYAVLFWKPSFAWMEGGGMFKRGELYYYMTGTDCCYCTWGGDARFWTSYAPLGPWHPGVAPPLPTERCDLSGEWQSLAGSPDAPQANETLTLAMAAGSDNFTFTDPNGKAAGWIDQATGYVTFPPSAGDHRGVVTSADGKAAGCDRVRWYGYESFIWCRKGADCPLPSYRDAPEVNLCADGSQPHEDVRVNPCDPNVEYGTNFTVPAQQFNVILAEVDDGAGGSATEVLYYGERANSTPDGNFSHKQVHYLGMVTPLNRLLTPKRPKPVTPPIAAFRHGYRSSLTRAAPSCR